MCITRTINLSYTKFRYQLVFFIYIYGWLKVAFGICCLGKTYGGIFCLGKTCCRHLLSRQNVRWYVLTCGVILIMHHVFGSFGLSTKEPHAIMLCPLLSKASVLALSVHTSPAQVFFFDLLSCPIYTVIETSYHMYLT